MVDLVLNTVGTTTTAGTNDPLISGETTKNQSMIDGLTEGQEIAYYRRYQSADIAGFENCVGIWRASTRTIERTRVEASSNGGAALFWTADAQIIDITLNPEVLTNVYGVVADTICEGNDPRLLSSAISDLPAVTELDGTELIPVEQSSLGKSVTSALLSPNPIAVKLGIDRTRLRGYSDFSATTRAFAATTGDLFGNEPYACYFQGTGATIGTSAALGAPAAIVSTGTDTNGYACVECTNYHPSKAETDYECTWEVQLTTLPTDADGAYEGRIGVFEGLGVFIATRDPSVFANGQPDKGTYFFIDSSSPNWQCVVRRNSTNPTESVTDSGVPYVKAVPIVLTVKYNYFSPEDVPVFNTEFFIDGVLVHTELSYSIHSTAIVTIVPAASIEKTSGATSASFSCRRNSYDFEVVDVNVPENI